MAATMLMKKGDMAREEADAVLVRLIAVFFKVALAATKLTNVEEGTRLNSMSLFFAPGALVFESLVGPVPRAVDSLFDAMDVSRV